MDNCKGCSLSVFLKNVLHPFRRTCFLLCSDDGKPFVQSDQLSRLLKQLPNKASILPQFPAHTIKHALVTAFFDSGLSDSQVNANAEHSNNAHSAATRNFHLSTRWIGHTIAAESVAPAAVASAGVLVEKDNAKRQAEKMAEYDESELDIPYSRSTLRTTSSANRKGSVSTTSAVHYSLSVSSDPISSSSSSSSHSPSVSRPLQG